jgi:hypothetical protein
MQDDFADARLPHAQCEETDQNPSPSGLLDLFGGEPLEGSGFESELPDNSADW